MSAINDIGNKKIGAQNSPSLLNSVKNEENLCIRELELHEDLLKDSVCTLSYRNIIQDNKRLFEGKIVLDVGCGTGIISLFAAEAGAAKVIAVDGSNIADVAKQVVVDNRYQHIVDVLKGEIDEVTMPQGIEQVDIIVSQWMGKCLYGESKFHSVLYARDKWLAPDGLVLPNMAKMYIMGITDNGQHAAHLSFWDNVEGLNLSCIRRAVAHETINDWVPVQQLLTDQCVVHSVNLYTASDEPINFRNNFRLKVQRAGIIHAMVVYFDVSFMLSKTQPVSGFSTSPHAPWTHWEHTLLHLDEPLRVEANEVVNGSFGMLSNEPGGRRIDLELNISFDGSLCQLQTFKKFNNNQQCKFRMQFFDGGGDSMP